MRIGNLDIERGVLLAPMEDVTDAPFRLLCRRLGADIVYTEYVNAGELLRGARRTRDKLLFRDEERPVGVQIYGGDPGTMGEAARLAASFGPDFIDINCGCWVKDVTRRGAGAALLRDLPRLEKVAAAVVKAVALPVTLKTRLGWDAQSIRIVEVARRCEAAGIQALTVHARTRDQGLGGSPDHDWIARLKQAVSIPIVLNGGIRTPQDVRLAFERTGCDAVMIGRAAVHDPSIFARAKHLVRTGSLPPEPSLAARVEVMRQHLQIAIEIQGEREGVRRLRKHCASLLRGMPDVQALRRELAQCTEAGAILERLARVVQLHAERTAAPSPASHTTAMPAKRAVSAAPGCRRAS